MEMMCAWKIDIKLYFSYNWKCIRHFSIFFHFCIVESRDDLKIFDSFCFVCVLKIVIRFVVCFFLSQIHIKHCAISLWILCDPKFFLWHRWLWCWVVQKGEKYKKKVKRKMWNFRKHLVPLAIYDFNILMGSGMILVWRTNKKRWTNSFSVFTSFFRRKKANFYISERRSR